MLNGLPWKWTDIIRSLLRLHPSTAFQTLLYNSIKHMNYLDAKDLNAHKDKMLMKETKTIL